MDETTQPTYQAGDGKCELLGVIKLADGRQFMGAIITFPVSPPSLPMSVVWDGAPVQITVRAGD